MNAVLLNYALIQNGKVTNIAVFQQGQVTSPGNWVLAPAGTAIGDNYVNGQFSKPPVIAPIPASITRRQCAKEMRARGLISDSEMVAMVATGTPPMLVMGLIEQLPEADRPDALADFAATEYYRSNELLVGLMTASGATSADIDDFFRSAGAR